MRFGADNVLHIHALLQSCHSVTRDIEAPTDKLQPDFPDAMDPRGLFDNEKDIGAQCLFPVAPIRQPGRGGPLGQVFIGGGRGDWEHVADRHDPVRIRVRVGETTPPSTGACEDFSFAWRSSRFSRSYAFIFSAVPVGMPARGPLLTSALLTQSFGAWGVQPIFAGIDMVASQILLKS